MSQQLQLPMQTTAELHARQTAAVFADINEVRSRAPALFATSAHPRMSERYEFTNTYDIVSLIHKRGFDVTSIMGGTKTYRKLMVRMRSTHHDIHHDSAPELILLDSHDGTSRYKMCLGAIKMACMNGIIAGDFIFSRGYTHSTRGLMAQIILDLDDVDAAIQLLIQRIAKMRGYKTTLAERIFLADAAIKRRYGENRDGSFVADMRQKMLNVRRSADDDSDLYTVMNVIQENVLRGGMSYTHNNRLLHVRPISQVDRNVHINQTLWTEAENIMNKRAA